MKHVWSTFWPVISVKCSILGRLLTISGQDGTITNCDSRKHGQGATCMQQHLFNHFCTVGHCGFLEDVSLTFIDKTDPSDPLKREDNGRIFKKVSGIFITNTLSICIFIGLGRFKDKGFRIYH